MMAARKIKKLITGKQTIDGAGVSLVRVLSRDTAEAFDPFLMLDSFDSQNPEDYVKGFPTHPHRGIETITYLVAGEIEHRDSLGNMGIIHAGECQWMTAGSGILHQEMPRASKHMLGVQIWLNLPADSKMTIPAYNSISADRIPAVVIPGGVVRVISGTYHGVNGGMVPQYISASIYDITLEADNEIILPTEAENTVFLFTITGSAVIAGRQKAPSKTVVLLSSGSSVQVTAPQDQECRFLFCSGKPLHEPIAWGGPIVMNTREELNKAFAELDDGNFIKSFRNGE